MKHFFFDDKIILYASNLQRCAKLCGRRQKHQNSLKFHKQSDGLVVIGAALDPLTAFMVAQ
jgi:hypothetical protein